MYTGDQTHSSVARAARHLGFRPDQLRVLPTDDAFRLRPRDVAAAIDADLAADRLPFLVSANAGTTNSGAVDPVGEIADVCHERGVWLHVDGALRRVRGPDRARSRCHASSGRADSVTLDPHKWLAMPFEVGCLLVREGPSSSERSSCTGVPAGGRAARWRELRRSGSAAHPRQSRDQGLARDPDVRARRVPSDESTAPSTDGRGSRGSRPTRLELVTAASLGIVTFRRRGQPGEPALDGSAQRGDRQVARHRRRRPPDVDHDPGPLHDPAVRVEPHDDVRRCRVRHRSGGGRGGIRARGGGRTREPAGRGHDGRAHR